MKVGTLAGSVVVVAALLVGCNATTRYEVLSLFLDGVPLPPKEPTAEELAAIPGQTFQPPKVRYREHGPYAAKLCSACHVSTALNSLVVPREQLCFRCHVFGAEKKFVHGPLASGGCTACHDPHSSQNAYLLISASDSFCLHCHDSKNIARNEVHRGIDEHQCTTCHNPHMSDKKYLLR